MIDYSDQGCLTGTVGSEKPVDFATRNLDSHIVECGVLSEGLDYVFGLQNVIVHFYCDWF